MQPVFKKKEMRMKRYWIIISAILLCTTFRANAQKVSLGTNVLEWTDFLTPNASLQLATGQHWSLEAAARYNRWSWRTAGTYEQRQVNERKARQQAYSFGARWWPWNVYSGWWIAARLQYQEYDYGGLSSFTWVPDNEAGDAFGAALLAGYDLQIHKHWNLEFGLGFWGGYKFFSRYALPWCGRLLERGERMFILPDQAMISVVYVF